ncbi:hypothetical protein PR202_ga22296 [Eleusine coracana subsp. coracana]|uniref:Uncharacterized protein n=1 Tax=Eleusine coracana subsp. coracana TaxID=191504 RepID=A0AAV5D2R1_ELECO|nr:hypothetical protein PR202_ga22296 [Eleusine coracana subsp. coracana]
MMPARPCSVGAFQRVHLTDKPSGKGVQRKGIASEGPPWTPRSFHTLPSSLGPPNGKKEKKASQTSFHHSPHPPSYLLLLFLCFAPRRVSSASSSARLLLLLAILAQLHLSAAESAACSSY